MSTLNIKLQDKKYIFLKDDSDFQSVITETILDYIEKKEDIETRNKLSTSKTFHNLNSKIEEKLGSL